MYWIKQAKFHVPHWHSITLELKCIPDTLHWDMGWCTLLPPSYLFLSLFYCINFYLSYILTFVRFAFPHLCIITSRFTILYFTLKCVADVYIWIKVSNGWTVKTSFIVKPTHNVHIYIHTNLHTERKEYYTFVHSLNFLPSIYTLFLSIPYLFFFHPSLSYLPMQSHKTWTTVHSCSYSLLNKSMNHNCDRRRTEGMWVLRCWVTLRRE